MGRPPLRVAWQWPAIQEAGARGPLGSPPRMCTANCAIPLVRPQAGWSDDTPVGVASPEPLACALQPASVPVAAADAIGSPAALPRSDGDTRLRLWPCASLPVFRALLNRLLSERAAPGQTAPPERVAAPRRCSCANQWTGAQLWCSRHRHSTGHKRPKHDVVCDASK